MLAAVTTSRNTVRDAEARSLVARDASPATQGRLECQVRIAALTGAGILSAQQAPDQGPRILESREGASRS